MVKLAVGLLVAVASLGASGDARAAGTKLFTGTIDSTSNADQFAICAAAGDAVSLSLREATTGAVTPLRVRFALLDEHGAPLPSLTNVWRVPRAGLYFARVTAEAVAMPSEYVVAATMGGGSAAADPIDLSVILGGAPDPVSAGDLLTYTIAVANAGPGVALYATMLDPLPAGTTFASARWTGPQEAWECTVPPVGTNGKVSCTNKCFEPGGSTTFTVTVRVNACVGNVQLTNLVKVSSADTDSQPGDNAAVATSSVTDPMTCDDGSVCTVGDGCAPATALAENFDSVIPRALPEGWSSRLVVGPVGAPAWRTGTGIVDTGPNSIFAADAPDVRDAVLDSPPIHIATSTAQVIFRNRYDLELLADGGVLELRIGNGPFLDVEEAGGHFEAGGYDGQIGDDFQSPIAGRRAWTGRTSGFVTTIVDLPPTVVGQDVVLRWRLATDRALGNIGQWVDTIVVTGPDTCRPGAALACDDGDLCTADSCDAAEGCRHAALSCDDGNPCTNDACDPATQCVHANNSTACDDHDACTLVDGCVSGACVGTSPLTCVSTDACAAAGCDASTGCFTASANLDATEFSASRVDGRDVAVLAAAWNSCPGDPRYNTAANLEPFGSCIDGTDFHLFMSSFGRTCTP